MRLNSFRFLHLDHSHFRMALSLMTLLHSTTVLGMGQSRLPDPPKRVETPSLVGAIHQSQFDLASRMIQGGVPLNQIDWRYEHTPLLAALESGNEALVRQLLAAGADPNYGEDDFFETPLHAASSPRFTRLLLKAGANVNSVDSEGRTPLFSALYRKDLRSVQTLLKAGADVNHSDENGQTPLMVASKYFNTEAIQTLAAAGAILNSVDQSGYSCLHHAIVSADPTKVKKLLELGANPNHQNHSGQTPLDLALKSRSRPIVYLLLQSGADPNLVNTDDDTFHQEAPNNAQDFFELYQDIQDCTSTEECVEIKSRLKLMMSQIEPSGLDRESIDWLGTLLKDRLEAVYFEQQITSATEANAQKVQCPVCLTDQTLCQTELTGAGPADCNCFLCESCSKNWLEHELKNGGGKVIQCPNCRGIASSTYLNKHAASPEHYKKLLKHQGEACAQSGTDEKLHCPTPNCSGLKRKRSDADTSNYYSCPLCDFQGCVKCKGDHHGPCKRAKKESDETQKNMAFLLKKGKLCPPKVYPDHPSDPQYYNGRWRPCYYCGIMTEKTEGCNGLECGNPSCRKEWHWNYGSHERHPKYLGGENHDYDREPRRYEPLVPPRF